MSNSVTATLCQALRLIRLREPDAYIAMTKRLEGMTVRLDFDDTLYLHVTGDEIVQSFAPGSSEISVIGDRHIVLDLVYGKITFTQAVYSGKLEIAGAIGPLTCALSALEYFVASLLRIEDAEELLIALEAA